MFVKAAYLQARNLIPRGDLFVGMTNTPSFGGPTTDITSSPDVIVHAACSGAMTATILAAVLAARREPLIHAMTLMVAVLGGNPDTQLGLFSTPEVIAAAKLETMRRGVLEGDEMSRVFAWMRPNDLRGCGTVTLPGFAVCLK